jgi:hypothetical protein
MGAVKIICVVMVVVTPSYRTSNITRARLIAVAS